MIKRLVSIVIFSGVVFVAVLPAQQADQGAFQSAVEPALTVCSACHNAQSAAGGLNLKGFEGVETVADFREHWEKIVQKISTAEMPPPGFPPLDPAVRDALLDAARAEFDRLDAAAPPNPGRVTARRLNRSEYSNTIRDLLGVRFDARGQFPSDDSGHGFDNIGDVLTISPILMEKYVDAAEVISRRALGADPLPAKPVEWQYEGNKKTIQRLGPGMIEARHRVEWAGEYIVRIGLQGARPKDSDPVLLRFERDGELLHEEIVPTEPGELIYFNPYSEAEMRLYLPAGDSTFRASFVNDNFTDDMEKEDIYDRDKNKYVDAIMFVGPFESDVEPPSRKKILVCDPNTGRACVERIISRLARRAYRRPVAADEIAQLMRFVDIADGEGLSTEQGVQLAIQAMLVSPHFLFRIERDDAAPGQIHAISDFELASRLSYFLWSSMPDDDLLDLAQAGKLQDDKTLKQQVDRMLVDKRAASFAENFSGQWLETRNLDSVDPDPELFPTWGPELREAMKMETSLFFDAILRENRPLGDFLDADFTFLNSTLAKHYGIEGISGEEFRRVELATDQRGGILSHASVLTVTSYPTRTSPVIRGKYVLENILGAAPPPPPPDIPALEESTAGPGASVRQQLEAHRASPACASCHSRMDALGFGLENYDAIGHWRTEEGENPLDSSGVLPNGQSFETPAELRKILLDGMDEFAGAMTEKTLIYALGRGLEPYDRITVKKIQKSLAEDDYRFQTLVHEVVNSLPFRQRRSENVENARLHEETLE